MGIFTRTSTESKRSTRIFAIALCLVMLFSAFSSPLLDIEMTASAGQTVSGTKSFNGISYKVFVPSSYSASKPMPAIVSMHGCMQQMDSFGTTTRIDTYAEKEGFIVIHVQQSSSNNASSCFNWFESGDQKRGSGEPKDIVDIINHVNNSYKIDYDSIFAYGFSAGGGMSPVLAATYPDIFKAIGVGSGLPYKAATDMTGAFSAMMSGPTVSADAIANNIISAMGSYKRPVPVIIFQGSSDYTVVPKNAELQAQSWLIANNKMGANINTTPTTTNETTSGGKAFTRTVYTDANGRRMIESLLVDGMGHNWSGGDGYNFSEPNGPNATEYMINFFKQFIGEQANVQAPVTTVSPASGTYTSAVTVSFSTDIEATTYYTTNGTTPTTSSSVYTAPFTVSHSTTVKFFSVSKDGGTEAVKSVTYTINIPEKDTTPPVTTHTPAAGVYYETINVTLSTNENATTYYTTDGSTPTTASKKYTGPIAVSSDTTIKYFSVDASNNKESIKTATYTVITDSSEGKYETISSNGVEHNIYISGKYRSGYSMPLLVMLHGDGQTPEQLAASTGMNKLADEKGFLVLYVKSASNNPMIAWGWYTQSAQNGKGDAAYISQAITTAIGRYYINSDKIYALGFGSGGAMANAVAATNPSLIAAVGIVSGTTFGSANSLTQAEHVKATGANVSGSLITSAMGSNKEFVPVIVFHGENDNVFAANNASQIIAQWATANDIADNGKEDGSVDSVADISSTATANGLRYTKESYKNVNGDVVMEKYIIHGLGYAWSGGSLGGNYASTNGPDASAIIYEFFKDSEYINTDVPVIEDTTAPVTTPSHDSGTYADSVTVSLSTDEQATTYYTTNGSNPTTSSAVYTAPLTFTSNTTLKFFSVDNAGNKESVKTYTYEIISSSVATVELSYDASNSGYAGYIYNFGAGSELKAGLGGYMLGDSVRAFIAFDNSIPVSSIQSVVLRLTVGNYNEAVTGLSIDVKNGNFGDAQGVKQTDFNKAADATAIASATPKTSGNIDFVIPSSAYQYLNGHVEFRVCTTVTNGINEAVMTFSNAKLIITYDAKANMPSTFSLSRAVTAAADDAITFTDSKLKNAIINAGVDTNGDGNISANEIANLYGLDASNLGITSISGLEYAVNLRYLDISSNDLTDVSSLSGCTALRYLNVSNNKISSINSLNADNLYMIIASNNSIADISTLSGLDYLDTVDFAENEVSDISALSGMTSLRTLDFTSCNIENISILSTLTYVNHLYFSSNKIASTDAINSLNYIIEKNFDTQNQPQPENHIISATVAKSGYNVIFTVTTLPGVSKISVSGNGSTVVSTHPTSSGETNVWKITLFAPSHTLTYTVDVYVNGAFVGENYEVEVKIGEDVETDGIIKNVDYVVSGDEVVFTVTTAPTLNRVKVTTEDALSSYLAYSSKYTVNKDGDYVFTLNIPVTIGTTKYVFDGRSAETGKYVKEYFYKTVTVEETAPETSNIVSVSHEFSDDRLIFTVITSTNDFTRVKISTADNANGSLGVGASSTVNADGNYVWIIKITAPTEDTSYAFDLRSAETGKYIKEYFYYDVAVQAAPEPVIKSVTHEFIDEKLIFTITTSAGNYNRIKLSSADNLAVSLAVGAYTVAANGDYVWTVKVIAPTADTSYAFDLRSSITGKYFKEYFYYDVTIPVNVNPIKSVSHTFADGKVIFTIVSASGEFNRIKVTTEDNLSGSLGIGTYTVNANGDYVWTIKIAASEYETTYAFDIRSGATGKYLKEYFYYDVEPQTSFVKSVNYEIANDKIIFTVVTGSGNYGRLKLTTADNLGGSIAVSTTYTINADGDYVWTIKADAPDSTTKYAIDARSLATGKYLKDYYVFTITL
ncbi:MAG: PHB depolymerase family esterase [Clostridia bacterium]|nr:PHB depolymerase family esterase [Clostridia bacterium]